MHAALCNLMYNVLGWVHKRNQKKPKKCALQNICLMLHNELSKKSSCFFNFMFVFFLRKMSFFGTLYYLFKRKNKGYIIIMYIFR